MKKIALYVFTVLLLASGCDSKTENKSKESTEEVKALPDTRADEDKPGDLLVETGKAGRISIGMTEQQVREQYSEQRMKKTQLQNEGMNYNAFLVHSLNNHEDVLFEVEMMCVNDCRVKRLFIQSDKMKTAEGIGIGSTFADLQHTYPITYVGSGEGNVVAASEEKNMSFMLDKSTIDKTKIPNLKMEDIPDSTKIVGILVL